MSIGLADTDIARKAAFLHPSLSKWAFDGRSTRHALEHFVQVVAIMENYVAQSPPGRGNRPTWYLSISIVSTLHIATVKDPAKITSFAQLTDRGKNDPNAA